MSDQIVIKNIKPISMVKRVYSGKPGCACGCRGKYYPDDENAKLTSKDLKMIRRVYKIFKNNLSANKVYSWIDSKDNFIVLDLGENRTYTIYYK